MGRKETNADKIRKRKREQSEQRKSTQDGAEGEVDTSRPTAVFKPTKGRDWTLSVALPGSIVANAQSHDLRTALAGHIARALSVFCVDEIIIFSDGTNTPPKHALDHSTEYTGTADPDHFLVHLLSYLETPPHLRRHLFPMHPDLRTAGSLHSLDLPHHLKPDEWCPYREGVTLENEGMVVTDTTQVEVGLRAPVTISAEIPPKTRVTIKFNEGAEAANTAGSRRIGGQPVHPALPREESGYYWGYTVRKADSLSAVFEECPHAGGYDTSIGTSERGVHVEDLFTEGSPAQVPGTFNHLLIVLGGVAGLEVALKNDKTLQKMGVTEAKELFDRWVNVCPGQGSRTIRTEEAVWIGLMGLRRLVERN